MKKTIIAIAVLLLSVFLLIGFVNRDQDKTAPEESQGVETTVSNEEEDADELEAGIEEIDKHGNITLNITPGTMQELGYEVADVILVRVGDTEMKMPIGTAYSDVDSGEPVCVFRTDKDCVDLSINMGSITSALKIAEINRIDEEPGFEIIWNEGFDENTSIYLSLAKKQGYAEEYSMHQLAGTRTNDREDYPDLTDAEYANFRAVNTTGMAADTLFRSSSPVDPALNRNTEADNMVVESRIHTVFNMTDSEESMKEYPDYLSTGYSGCDIIALNMSIDFHDDEFSEQLAEGYRYMAAHEGPYLIHCTEGKDRTGFAVAMLSCLMGAGADEIIADYMLTYYNFYGVEPGTEQYDKIADSNIKDSLAEVFEIEAIDAEGVDLAACASDYLKSIGMTEEEITSLKNNLSKEWL